MFLKEAKEIKEQIIQWRHDIHKIAEVGMETFETAKYTLPSNVTGFTAQVFCWDDLVNIKPLSDSVVIPQ